MAQEILKNIYRIQVPLPRNPLRLLNSYLIRGEERSLLIDTGFRQPECREALFAALDDLQVDRNTLDVFGTHIHSDHIGLAPEVVSPGGSIYLGEGDFHWLSSKEDAFYWSTMDERFLKEGFPAALLDSLVDSNPARNFGPQLDLPSYRVVKGGDVFELGGYHLEVIEAPGHTPGMVCLWMEAEGVMFTADHILFDITPNITMWPNMENSLGTYMNSLRRFRAFPVRKSLPGHREEGDYLGRIEALLLHHEQRVGETEAIVRAQPGQTAYAIASQMTWAIRAKNWDEFPVIQKWFAVGEALAHLDYLCAEGRILRTEDGKRNHYMPLG